MKKYIAAVAVALALLLPSNGLSFAAGQPKQEVTPTHGLQPWISWCLQTPSCLKANPWVKAKVWRAWCKHHSSCSATHPWVWRNNPVNRFHAWQHWCARHSVCYSKHRRYAPQVVTLGGPWGRQIMAWPEGGYLGTFLAVAHNYGIDVRILLAIGVAESSGGTASSIYMGCMDSSTYGSWPAQVNCGARVLANCGFGCYNSVNPSYEGTVENIASGIILEYGRA